MPWGHRSGAVSPRDSELSTETCVNRLAHSDSLTYHTCESVRRGCREETTGWKPTERHENGACVRKARAESDGKPYQPVLSSEISIVSQIKLDVNPQNAMRICSETQKGSTTKESNTWAAQKTSLRNRCQQGSDSATNSELGWELGIFCISLKRS